MHIYYKFGLYLIFILSVSTCHTRAAPATNQSASYDDNDYHDDYDDYYGENGGDGQATVQSEVTSPATPSHTSPPTTTTTTSSSLFSLFEFPKRSNHVIEPTCPTSCRCLEDYKHIQCSHGRLEQVPPNIPRSAAIVDLSDNQITELRIEDFANRTKLMEINLNNNQIAHIAKETLEGLDHLQRLHLASNRLTQLEPDTFAAAGNLSILDLSNNTITLRDVGSFLNQPALLELSCRNCSWTQLYDDTFANLSGLTTLKLDHNDFNKKINTKAFEPLRNLIKLQLPDLEQSSVEELCNLLKSIDSINFKHFAISCFELVLGTSYNESLIRATVEPPDVAAPATTTTVATTAIDATRTTTTNHMNRTTQQQQQQQQQTQQILNANSSLERDMSSNVTQVTGGDEVYNNNNNNNSTQLSKAGIGLSTTKDDDDDDDRAYQVPVSQHTINILLICMMAVAVVGLLIGLVCRKDVGGIKTKCCRTRKPQSKDQQIEPAEEIPLNQLS